MSETKKYKIACPKCRHEFEVALYESVNVGVNPELREALMTNRLNQAVCDACHFSFRVDKTLLYSDPARRLMVYWLPMPDDNIEEGEELFSEWLLTMGKMLPPDVRAPEVHLVFSRMDLVEKIFMLEAGLDPRIIEYIKHLIYLKNGVKLAPAEKALLFNAQDSTAEHLVFVIMDLKTRAFESVLQYNREAYAGFCELFATPEKSADLLELFPGPHISARMTLLKDSGGIDGAVPSAED